MLWALRWGPHGSNKEVDMRTVQSCKKNTALLSKASPLYQNHSVWEYQLFTQHSIRDTGVTSHQTLELLRVISCYNSWSLLTWTALELWTCQVNWCNYSALALHRLSFHSPQACWAEIHLRTAAPCYIWQPEIKGGSAQFQRLFLISSNSSCLQWGGETKLII